MQKSHGLPPRCRCLSLAPHRQRQSWSGRPIAGGGSPATLYRIDHLTGAAALIGPIGFTSVGALDFDGSTLYGVSTLAGGGGSPSTLITIDPLSGLGAAVGPTNPGGTETDVRYDISFRNGDGTLHGLGPSGAPPDFCVTPATLDTGTGAATIIGASTTCDAGNALGFSLTDILYQIDLGLGIDGSLYIVDQVTGTAALSMPISLLGFPGGLSGSGVRINAMDFNPVTGVAYVSVNAGDSGGADNFLGTLDVTTGAITHIGSTVDGLDGLAWIETAEVPEPGTSALLGIALVSVVMVRRRRR